MVRELELVVAGEFLDIASVLVLRVAVIAVPIVFLCGRRPFMNVISRPFVAFKQSKF